MNANEFTVPADLKNLGLKCHDCCSGNVVYTVTIINPHFPLGTYCLDCLINRCRATRRPAPRGMHQEYMYAIPMPMEWNLLSRVKVALGLEKPSDSPMF